MAAVSRKSSGPSDLKRIWKVLTRHVPLTCMAGDLLPGWSGVYGAPGWMRLFPHDVFQVLNEELEHLIWADAGSVELLRGSWQLSIR